MCGPITHRRPLLTASTEQMDACCRGGPQRGGTTLCGRVSAQHGVFCCRDLSILKQDKGRLKVIEPSQTCPGAYSSGRMALTQLDDYVLPLPGPVAALRTLYGKSQAHQSSKLTVSPVHTLYYEVHGNPNGQPVLCVHGGPGAGAYANHA